MTAFLVEYCTTILRLLEKHGNAILTDFYWCTLYTSITVMYLLSCVQVNVVIVNPL